MLPPYLHVAAAAADAPPHAEPPPSLPPSLQASPVRTAVDSSDRLQEGSPAGAAAAESEEREEAQQGSLEEQLNSGEQQPLQLDERSQSAALAAAHNEPPPLPQNAAAADTTEEEDEWLLFNDFAVARTPAAEVAQLYGGQKVPCLLYFTQAAALESARRMPPPVPAPVLSFEAFRTLCAAPPLQQPPPPPQQPRPFRPLAPDEAVTPGTLLGIDTEFVAHSPPDTLFR